MTEKEFVRSRCADALVKAHDMLKSHPLPGDPMHEGLVFIVCALEEIAEGVEEETK